jgi:PAS domain S-box-containing protein
MLSARAGEEARAGAIEAGVVDYLVKPFSARELLARVHTHVELGRLRSRLRAEREALYSLLMQAPAPICVFRGEELVFEMANDLYLKVTGLTSAAIGRTLYETIPETRAQGFEALLRGVLRSGEPHASEAMPFKFDRRGDGTLENTWWSFIYAPLRSVDGTVERVMALVQEMTPQVLAREERERHIGELQRTVRFSELFAGILAHDLRTPLGAIVMTAQVLSRQGGVPGVGQSVSRILRSTDRMARMIDQLLDLTQIRLGHGLPIAPSETDLSLARLGVVDELELAHDCVIHFEHAGSLVGTWDRDRLAQLLSNLVGNACQHRVAGTTVLLRASGTVDAVVLEVSNEGVIPAALLPDLFEPLLEAASRKQGASSSGLGLGLYISREVARAHGGTIRVESSEPAGTRFIVDLPRHAPQVPGCQPAAGTTRA